VRWPSLLSKKQNTFCSRVPKCAFCNAFGLSPHGAPLTFANRARRIGCRSHARVETVKFGIRKPSLTKRIAARTSLPRFLRHSLGVKAPRGYGWLTNPRRAAYNRIYNRTTVKADNLILLAIAVLIAIVGWVIAGLVRICRPGKDANLACCPRCNSPMIFRDGPRGKFYSCSRFPRCRGTRDYLPGAATAISKSE
jgi:hypothetical protein